MANKFRAKRQGERAWWIEFSVSHDLKTVWYEGEQYDVEEDDIILNQSTGVNDSDGSGEIFEDDILEDDMKVIFDSKLGMFVKEDEYGNRFHLDTENGETVIGNSWDKEED
jgi:hypothetical protein